MPSRRSLHGRHRGGEIQRTLPHTWSIYNSLEKSYNYLSYSKEFVHGFSGRKENNGWQQGGINNSQDIDGAEIFDRCSGFELDSDILLGSCLPPLHLHVVALFGQLRMIISTEG
jgi:hypothetical protein